MFNKHSSILIKYKKFQSYIFKMFFLKNFNQKNIFQACFSILYTLIFFIISCLVFVPIIASFINGVNLNRDSSIIHGFLMASFITSFFYLLDFIIRIIVMLDYYGTNKFSIAIKKQLLSIYTYVELITFLTTICIIGVHGHFVNDGIMLDTNQVSAIATTVICFLFLANLLNSFHRISVFWHNETEIKMFRHILKSKVKLWVIFFLIIVVVLFAFSFFIYLSDQAQATIDNPSDFKDMGDALYFCIVTITTVGFGDIVAKAEVSRVYVILLMIIGVFLYSFLSSQIISVFGEYFTGKKQISQEISLCKKKEEDLNNLVNNIEDTLLETLYKAKVISKTNYHKIIKTRNANSEPNNNIYDEANFTFDSNNKTIYYKDKVLGKNITDANEIRKAEEVIWAVNKNALKDKRIVANTVLYKLPMKQLAEIIEENVHTQIIFSKNPIPSSIKKMIFYQKKPYIAALAQAEVKGVLMDNKNKIWEKFGIYSNLNKKKFFNIFKEQDQISVILITNIIVYKNSKSIQQYGINDASLLRGGITPLM